jgi:predicted Zn finger-like uncharacterized protein
MKFLCNSCKAKYQIADEKVAGRTLKMKCRKCGHAIIIQGAAPAPSASAKAAAPPPTPSRPSRPAAPPRPAPAVSGPPSARSGALGQDFRRQMASAEPPPVAAPPPNQWHVAINDVPVGPLERGELGRKVASGSVHSGSLVWREGFDDWRPLGQVSELADLLAAPASAPASAPSLPSLSPDSRSTRPAEPRAAGGVVPIGGRQGASAAPSQGPRPMGMLSDAPVSDPGSGALGSPAVPAPPAPQPAPPAPETTRRGPAIPVGGWIAIAGAAAFGVALAVMVGGKLLGDDPRESVAAAADVQGPEHETGEAPVEPDMVIAEGDLDDFEDDPGADEDDEGSTEEASGSTAKRRTARRAARPASGSSTGGKKLSAEQQKMLDRFSGESGAAPSSIRGASGSTGGGSSTGKGLDARQLTSVVSKNRPELQRCYEVAVRGLGDAPTVRMDVDVSVGMSGTVTRVRARGSGVGNLRECIERSVRRWRFPSSGNETNTSFPVVFSAGG